MLLLSWLGGYAVCARLAGDAVHAGRMDRDQAQRFWIVSCCSGPGFVIGCVGGLMLGSVRLGALLYGLAAGGQFWRRRGLEPCRAAAPDWQACTGLSAGRRTG